MNHLFYDIVGINNPFYDIVGDAQFKPIGVPMQYEILGPGAGVGACVGSFWSKTKKAGMFALNPFAAAQVEAAKKLGKLIKRSKKKKHDFRGQNQGGIDPSSLPDVSASHGGRESGAPVDDMNDDLGDSEEDFSDIEDVASGFDWSRKGLTEAFFKLGSKKIHGVPVGMFNMMWLSDAAARKVLGKKTYDKLSAMGDNPHAQDMLKGAALVDVLTKAQKGDEKAQNQLTYMAKEAVHGNKDAEYAMYLMKKFNEHME